MFREVFFLCFCDNNDYEFHLPVYSISVMTNLKYYFQEFFPFPLRKKLIYLLVEIDCN